MISHECKMNIISNRHITTGLLIHLGRKKVALQRDCHIFNSVVVITWPVCTLHVQCNLL